MEMTEGLSVGERGNESQPLRADLTGQCSPKSSRKALKNARKQAQEEQRGEK